jgi:hypothetical protein
VPPIAREDTFCQPLPESTDNFAELKPLSSPHCAYTVLFWPTETNGSVWSTNKYTGGPGGKGGVLQLPVLELQPYGHVWFVTFVEK